MIIFAFWPVAPYMIENKLCVCGAHQETERPKKPVDRADFQEQLVMIVVMMMVVVMIFVFPFYIYKLPINCLCGRYVTWQNGQKIE